MKKIEGMKIKRECGSEGKWEENGKLRDGKYKKSVGLEVMQRVFCRVG